MEKNRRTIGVQLCVGPTCSIFSTEGPYMFNLLTTSSNQENGGLYNKFFEKIEFQKKKMRSKMGRKF